MRLLKDKDFKQCYAKQLRENSSKGKFEGRFARLCAVDPTVAGRGFVNEVAVTLSSAAMVLCLYGGGFDRFALVGKHSWRQSRKFPSLA